MARKLLPLPGYTYMGRNGQSNGPRMLVATLVTLGLAFVAVVLRLFVKGTITHTLGWEDAFAVAALLLAIARSTMLGLMALRYQFGQHIWDIEHANFGYNYQWAKAATILYLASMAFAKLSVLLLYLKVFRVNKLFRVFCYTMMGFVTTYCLAMILANVFQCTPIKAGWEFFLPGKCASLQKITVATGALNIATDVALVVAPLIMATTLQIRRAKMVGLLLVFATGFFVVAVTIVREVEVVRAPSLYDATYPDAIRTLWLSVELHIGIVCICMPTLSPLLKHVPTAKYLRDRYGSWVSMLSRRSGSGRHPQSRTKTSEAKAHLGSDDSVYLHKLGTVESIRLSSTRGTERGSDVV